MATQEEVGGLVRGGPANQAAVDGSVADPKGVYIDGKLVESNYSERESS